MRLNEVRFDSGLPVDSYGPGFFRLNGEVIHGPVLVGPGGLIEWGGLEDPAPLLSLAGQVDVVFMGMGNLIRHLPEALQQAIDHAGVPAEVMATGPAARTYNVLLSEGRRVAAALLPV